MDQIKALLPFLEMRVDRGSALDHSLADLDDDGGLTRSEFVEMCAVVLAVQHVEKAVLVGHRLQCQPLVGYSWDRDLGFCGAGALCGGE